MVKRVARRVTLGLCESKRFATINEQFQGQALVLGTNNSQWTYKNLFVTLATSNQQGDSHGIIGNEIANVMAKFKFTAIVDWNQISLTGAANYGSVGVSVYLVAANDSYSSGVPANFFGISSNPGWVYQRDGFRPTLNGNNCRVLKRWHRRITPTVLGTPTNIQGVTQVTGSMKYRWRRKLQYEDASAIPTEGGPVTTTILRGWNYYLLTCVGVYATLSSNVGFPKLYVDTFMYYKDP